LIENGVTLWVDPTEFADKIVEVSASSASAADDVRGALTIWIQEHLITPTESSIRLQAGWKPGEIRQ